MSAPRLASSQALHPSNASMEEELMSSRPVSGESGDANAVSARNGARNQALMRDLNEQVCAFAACSTTEDTVLVMCECAEVSCSLTLSLSPDEYERIRSSPTQFVVRPDHALADGETIVQETPGYVVVEKVGEGATIATRLDPQREL
jgi:hypothetical protein